MSISKPIEILELESGISISLSNETRHYFGGYYHVKILAHCDIFLDRGFFDDETEYLDALQRLGKSVRFERFLEKMAVPEQNIESELNQLVTAFKQTAVPYLSAPDFECRLVRSEYRLSLNKTAKKFPSRMF